MSKILITGTPNSGTRYAYLMLQKAFGLDVVHEVGESKDALVSWRELRFLPERSKDYSVILHQTRHPLHNINSMCAINRKRSVLQIYRSGIVPYGIGEEFNLSYYELPEVRIFTAMKIWYYWNAYAEKVCQWRYQIERILDVFPKFCIKIGAVGKPETIKKMSRNINSRKNRTGYIVNTWEDLERIDLKLCALIKCKMVEYGYEA
jgi:hypothetical protein